MKLSNDMIPAKTNAHRSAKRNHSIDMDGREPGFKSNPYKKQPLIQRKQAGNRKVDNVPPVVDEVLNSTGNSLDASTKNDMEPYFGHDFSKVRVHTNSKAALSAQAVNAQAYTVGRDIVFGPNQFAPQTNIGRSLLTHELTHVIQQNNGVAKHTISRGEETALENEADKAAKLFGTTGSHPFVPRLAGSGLQAQKAPAGPSPALELAIILSTVKAGITNAEALKILSIYKKLPAAERKKAFDSYYASGEITILLGAIKPADASELYRDEVAQILRWVEETETRKTSGMTDEQMADTQSKFKQAEAEKEAQKKIAAKAPPGPPPPKPTTKEIEEARKETMQKTSIQPTIVTTWDKKTKAEKDGWTKRGEDIIKKLVVYAAKKHPELKLTEARFLADFGGVEKRGARVLAYGQGDGKGGTLAVFGFRFVEAAEANLDYVMSVIVHEIFGHPEYGPYGSEYHLELYDKAQAKMPGYTKPAAGTTERTRELDAYAYQETEIFSLLRSFSYHTSLSAADSGKGLVSIDPTKTVEARLGLIQQQWEPKLAIAIVRGLYQRLLQDPRITGPALNAFKAGVKIKFAADEKQILK